MKLAEALALRADANRRVEQLRARIVGSDAMKQLLSAAAPLLQSLGPRARDSIQRTGRTAEE